MTVVKPYTFVPGTDIVADEVNANFDELVDALNNDYVDAAAVTPFTNIPTGPAADPTTDNQLVRKAYVDKPYALATRAFTAGSSSSVFTNITSLTDSASRDVTVGSGALTVASAGLYLIGFEAVWGSNGSGVRQLCITLNSTSVTDGSLASVPVGRSTDGNTSSVSGLGLRQGASRLVSLSAGDVLRPFYKQSSGSNLSLDFAMFVNKVS